MISLICSLSVVATCLAPNVAWYGKGDIKVEMLTKSSVNYLVSVKELDCSTCKEQGDDLYCKYRYRKTIVKRDKCVTDSE